MNSVLPPPPPLNYKFQARPFRGKPPSFDGHNFEFYREELSLWMKRNFSIDWTLITDDTLRNNQKPTDPHLEYCDQENAWEAIFNGCKYVHALQPILKLTFCGTKHMEFASFAWKDIVDFYNPDTPAAKRQKILQFKAAVANFTGDIASYRTAIRSLLADLGQCAPTNEEIMQRMMCGVWNSPAGGNLQDQLSWRSFVMEIAKSDKSELDNFFNHATQHAQFQRECLSAAATSDTTAKRDAAVISNNTTTKGKRDREDEESSNEDKDEERCKERCKERCTERCKERSKANDKTTSPSVKSKRQRRRPQKHVRLQQKAAAEQA
eukprot:CAMPEP_0181304104 /NCGR_PEP_ID=MMETSP1101-20121128/8950_1 /TAXON_ID=46948 /ORGANISM="Rhodomonas abbreviata, Strain Caron Lab Isolate" /LENGTH=321 /DNA_ID=CAMNT_0023409795 /DNA_START=1303 /DNA_END=2265 /DNA_ORIENTATION=+